MSADHGLLRELKVGEHRKHRYTPEQLARGRKASNELIAFAAASRQRLAEIDRDFPG